MFSHRIADTQKIKARGLPDITRRFKKITDPIPAVPMLVFVFALGIMLYFKGWPTTINYLVTTESNKIIEVSISPKPDGTVVVRGVGTPYKKTLAVDEFFKQKGLKPKVVSLRFMYFYIIILICSFIILIFGILLYFNIADRKAKKLLRLLSIPE
jgi:hypothetical protein